MPHFHDIWLWMTALKTSPFFALVLPIALAAAFASLTDWVEHYLGNYQQRETAEDPSASADLRLSWSTTPGIGPVLEGDGRIS